MRRSVENRIQRLIASNGHITSCEVSRPTRVTIRTSPFIRRTDDLYLSRGEGWRGGVAMRGPSLLLRARGERIDRQTDRQIDR